ncbi:Uu.00g111800.m01.CDS01 [Anthostomella pinea]|uniref:Uu.00g111800.m01.CDS01 n=1 Tax=Anthostomella pinea TaxID=933095 RepID=A0AAI8VA05_9PEZI|nr:Uu.00g111800.m01.CDS01 [Anthostomella pinea]
MEPHGSTATNLFTPFVERLGLPASFDSREKCLDYCAEEAKKKKKKREQRGDDKATSPDGQRSSSQPSRFILGSDESGIGVSNLVDFFQLVDYLDIARLKTIFRKEHADVEEKQGKGMLIEGRACRNEKVKANRAFVVFSVADLNVDVKQARYEIVQFVAIANRQSHDPARHAGERESEMRTANVRGPRQTKPDMKDHLEEQQFAALFWDYNNEAYNVKAYNVKAYNADAYNA